MTLPDRLWKHAMNLTWTALPLWAALATQAMTATPLDCAGLRDVALKNAKITAVEMVRKGPYKTRQAPRESSFDLPAHCRVAALLTPSDDSHIEMELWLPLDWNGKFLAVGNGGWAGSISYRALAAGVKEGYATASNDTGHQDRGASFVMGHPEKLIDFAHRAMHEMTVQSKKLVRAFYQKEIQHSYYQGCSTGGRQGLMAAQRYPADFDGIVAGAPANPMTEKHSGDAERSRQAHRDRRNLLSRDQLRLVHQAAIEACDSHDGIEDGLLTDPSACSFDPAELLCRAGESGSGCLTAGQLESVRAAYGPVNDQNGDLVYAGYSPGSEMSWRFLLDGSNGVGTALDTFRYAVQFDLTRDRRLALERAGVLNASSDLAGFRARGGKMILYHGWADGAIVAQNTANYHAEVEERLGGDQRDWLRLFMVPGMGHCGGGEGPNQVNWLAALERWVEAKKAPERITAHRVRNNRVELTRPLCPYPAVAKWSGVGSVTDEANFQCAEP
jgi:feruloyl esterase